MWFRSLSPWPFALMLCVFAWQFLLGCIIGSEAGFLLFIPAGMLPTMVLGAPWFYLLMPSGDLDLSLRALMTSLALRYHAAAFVSLMLNAFIVSLAIAGVRGMIRGNRVKS